MTPNSNPSKPDKFKKPKIKKKEEKLRNSESGESRPFIDLRNVGPVLQPLLRVINDAKLYEKNDRPALEALLASLQAAENKIQLHSPEHDNAKTLIELIKRGLSSEESFAKLDFDELRIQAQALITNAETDAETKANKPKEVKTSDSLIEAQTIYNSLTADKKLQDSLIPKDEYTEAYNATIAIVKDLSQENPKYENYPFLLKHSLFNYDLSLFLDAPVIAEIKNDFAQLLDKTQSNYIKARMLKSKLESVVNPMMIAKLNAIKIESNEKIARDHRNMQENFVPKAEAEVLKVPPSLPSPDLQAAYVGALRVPGPTTLSDLNRPLVNQPKWQQDLRNFVKNRIPKALQFPTFKRFLPTLKSQTELNLNTIKEIERVNFYRVRISDMIKDYKFIVEARMGHKLSKAQIETIKHGDDVQISSMDIPEPQQMSNLQKIINEEKINLNNGRAEYLQSTSLEFAIHSIYLLQNKLEEITDDPIFKIVKSKDGYNPLDKNDSKHYNIGAKEQKRNIELFLSDMNKGPRFIEDLYEKRKNTISQQAPSNEPVTNPTQPPVAPTPNTNLLQELGEDENLTITPATGIEENPDTQYPIEENTSQISKAPDQTINKDFKVQNETDFINKYFANQNVTIDSASRRPPLGNNQVQMSSISGVDEKGQPFRRDLSTIVKTDFENKLLEEIYNHLLGDRRVEEKTVSIKDGKISKLTNKIGTVNNPPTQTNLTTQPINPPAPKTEIVSNPPTSSDNDVETNEQPEYANEAYFINSPEFKKDNTKIFSNLFSKVENKSLLIKSISSKNEGMQVRFTDSNDEHQETDVLFTNSDAINILEQFRIHSLKIERMGMGPKIARNNIEQVSFLIRKEKYKEEFKSFESAVESYTNQLKEKGLFTVEDPISIAIKSVDPLELDVIDIRGKRIEDVDTMEAFKSNLASINPVFINELKDQKYKIQVINNVYNKSNDFKYQIEFDSLDLYVDYVKPYSD